VLYRKELDVMLQRHTLLAILALGTLAPLSLAFDDVAAGTYYNPYTGKTTKVAGAYNPYTGKADVAHTTTTAGGTTAARGATYNPYTGAYHGETTATTASGTKEESKTYYNPATGKTDHVQGAYNPYTGKYAVHASAYRR
jgi:hypothetical protein